VLSQWDGDIAQLKTVDLSVLTEGHEKALMQRLSAYPETVANAGAELAPHVIANYLKELASDLHSYYNEYKFLIENEAVKLARLSLILATQQVLKNGLELLGVSAPTRM
jgi:arginyl-tRNA synthetase